MTVQEHTWLEENRHSLGDVSEGREIATGTLVDLETEVDHKVL